MSLDKLGPKMVKRDGGGAVNVQDLDNKQLLKSILLQLKILNIHFQEISGVEIEERDLEMRDLD